jgi:hypothetical protein
MRSKQTLWANLCCWRLKLLALDFIAEVRARAVKALCIVAKEVVCGKGERFNQFFRAPAQCKMEGRDEDVGRRDREDCGERASMLRCC